MRYGDQAMGPAAANGGNGGVRDGLQNRAAGR